MESLNNVFNVCGDGQFVNTTVKRKKRIVGKDPRSLFKEIALTRKGHKHFTY